MVRLKVTVPMEISVVLPQTGTGQRALACRIAEAHADWVLCTIDGLSCPAQQKLALLQAVIDTIRGTYRAPGPAAGPP